MSVPNKDLISLYFAMFTSALLPIFSVIQAKKPIFSLKKWQLMETVAINRVAIGLLLRES